MEVTAMIRYFWRI